VYVPRSIRALTHCLMELGKGSAHYSVCILKAMGCCQPVVVSMLSARELSGNGLGLLRALVMEGSDGMQKAMQRTLVPKQDVLRAVVWWCGGDAGRAGTRWGQ
jgi:hypothetical protein